MDDGGDFSFRWFLKMRRLKEVLRGWSKSSFGDIFAKVKEAEEEVKLAQEIVDGSYSETGLQHLVVANQTLHETMRQEELFWSQKARCQWLKEGNRNTSFFHCRVRNKRQRSFIHAIKIDDGHWVHDIKDIQDEGNSFFEKLFSFDGNVTDDELLHVIPEVITPEDSVYLTAIPD